MRRPIAALAVALAVAACAADHPPEASVAAGDSAAAGPATRSNAVPVALAVAAVVVAGLLLIGLSNATVMPDTAP